MGGNLAYLLSVRFKPDCAVGYYGVGIEKGLAEAKTLGSPLLLHIAQEDKFCPPEAQAQIHEALDSNPLVTIHDYPGWSTRLGVPAVSITHRLPRSLRICGVWILVKSRGAGCASAQQTLSQRWTITSNMNLRRATPDDTIETMVVDAYVNHVPV
jgi:carboxymethylenebutenolidase